MTESKLVDAQVWELGEKTDWEGTQRNFWGVMKMFFILVVLVVAQVHTFVKIL